MQAPFVVGVAGISGSGKSTVCAGLQQRLGEGHVRLVSMDSYYRDLSHLSAPARAHVNFDRPEALDLDLLVGHLDLLRSGHTVEVPRYDFASHRRTGPSTPVPPAPVILVEGLFCLAYAPLARVLDLKVYIDAPEKICLSRRLRRDVNERGRRSGDVLEQYFATVLPAAREIVAPSRDLADVAVGGTGNPERAIDEICRWIEAAAFARAA